MKKPYKNDAMNQKKVYNILLVGFAILIIGLLILNGPPSAANPPNITTPSTQVCSPLQVMPTQIRWYEMRDGETRLSVERIDNEVWQLRGQSEETIDNKVAEEGARVIAAFQVCELVQFGASDDLSQYGLTLSPSYVISFGVVEMDDDLNNSGAEQPFTLYIGDLNPSQQYYYAVFVDETDPQQPSRQGEWVYLMPTPFVDTLADAMFNRLRTDVLPSSTETGTSEDNP